MVMRKPRKVRPDERYQGYDSRFEHDLHRGILRNWKAHDGYVKYTVEKKYFPDFTRVIDGKTIYIEAKGRFWDSEEYSKYLHARECLPEDAEIVFLFYNPYHPMPRSKKRRDGTKRTHAEWAEDNGFRWYCMKTFPEELM